MGVGAKKSEMWLALCNTHGGLGMLGFGWESVDGSKWGAFLSFFNFSRRRGARMGCGMMYVLLCFLLCTYVRWMKVEVGKKEKSLIVGFGFCKMKFYK